MVLGLLRPSGQASSCPGGELSGQLLRQKVSFRLLPTHQAEVCESLLWPGYARTLSMSVLDTLSAEGREGGSPSPPRPVVSTGTCFPVRSSENTIPVENL